MSKKSSIEVAIRIRPMRAELSEAKVSWDVNNVSLKEKANPDCHFTFERVYNTNATTGIMYEQSVKENIVKNVSLGYNGTVFAYGQTGSGKSFTMLGSGESEGVVSMAIKDLFALLDKERSANKSVDIQVFISMLEIYNEQLRDLLISPGAVGAPLSIRENEYGVYVHNATKRLVRNAKECLYVIQNEAESRRVSAATAMNERSSRSHCLIRVHVEKTFSYDVSDSDSESDGEDAPAGADSSALKKKIVSSLNLVDLAGSERVAKTGATGIRMVEGGHINKSLTILTTVINKLTETTTTKGTYIPYRDSKLTHLLKTAIGGNSFTTVFCCMTPAEQHTDESRSTLQFAARAKTIRNEVSMNEIADSKTKIRELEGDVKRLKRTVVALDIYLWAKQLKIKMLTEGSGGNKSSSPRKLQDLANTTVADTQPSSVGGTQAIAAQEQLAQYHMIVEQLSQQNEELQRELQATVADKSRRSFDPNIGIADDPETRKLRQRCGELEEQLQDVTEERNAMEEDLEELDGVVKELEEENAAKSSELSEALHRAKSLETQLTSAKSLEQSLSKQLDQLQTQIRNEGQRAMDRARGDDLLEQLTKLHVEHQTLQFEHNTLMDMYSREEIEKAASIDLLQERIAEMERDKEDARVASQLQNSYLWRLLAIAALVTHGKPIDPEETKAVVRDHQVESAVKALTSFVSSRMNRPPGIVQGNGGDDDDSAPTTPVDWKLAALEAKKSSAANGGSLKSDATSSVSVGGDESLVKRIKELEQQLVAKDAQRDIIIDTKLKRIQDLVLRLHTTNTKLTQELHLLGTQNNELFEIIKKEPKLLHKLNKTNLTPFNETDAIARAAFAPVPQKPFGHN